MQWPYKNVTLLNRKQIKIIILLFICSLSHCFNFNPSKIYQHLLNLSLKKGLFIILALCSLQFEETWPAYYYKRMRHIEDTIRLDIEDAYSLHPHPHTHDRIWTWDKYTFVCDQGCTYLEDSLLWFEFQPCIKDICQYMCMSWSIPWRGTCLQDLVHKTNKS